MASVIVNIRPWFWMAPASMKQFADPVRTRLVSQSVNDILRFPQKLLIYFNGSIFWTSYVPLFPVWPAIPCLHLNEVLSVLSGKSIMAPLSSKPGSSLCSHKLPDVLE